MRKTSFLVAIFVSLAAGHAAAQQTWYVDDSNCPGPGSGSSADPFCTIQAGIDAAANGDTVIIRDGTYTGSGNHDLDFGGKAITVRSANGPANCIIDPNNEGRSFHFHSGETASSVLQGVTMTGGYGSDGEVNGIVLPVVGGGLYCVQASPTINDCVITANNGRYAGGGVVLTRSGAALNNCTISNNEAHYTAGAGVALSNSTAVLTGCLITGNTIGLGDGGGVYTGDEDNSTLVNCTIMNNSGKHGGGVHCMRSYTTLNGCTITDNLADTGAGVLGRYAELTLTGCQIQDNTALYAGGGLYFDSFSTANATNCLITGNGAAYYSGGAAFFFRSDAVLTNCTLADNDANKAGALYGRWGDITLVNCILWNDSPAEIFLATTATTFSATYSNIQGGWTGTGNINDDPKFVSGYYLSQMLAGQPADSPCVDAGDPSSSLIDGTTRTDLQPDTGIVDMGYHDPGSS